jgi:hypothetical protein
MHITDNLHGSCFEREHVALESLQEVSSTDCLGGVCTEANHLKGDWGTCCAPLFTGVACRAMQKPKG